LGKKLVNALGRQRLETRGVNRYSALPGAGGVP
jgi:hypothetical protein